MPAVFNDKKSINKKQVDSITAPKLKKTTHIHSQSSKHSQLSEIGETSQIKNKDYLNVRLVTSFICLLISIFLIKNAFNYPLSEYRNNNGTRINVISNQAKINSTDTKIIIEKLGIDAPIINVETRDNSAVMEGLRDGIVRYAGTADPGKYGNSFLIGHSSDHFWKPGNYKQVFKEINTLEKDDIVKIVQGKNTTYFKVVEKRIIEPNDFSVLSQSDKKQITLMTCWPPGTIKKRYIVKLVEA